MSKPSLQRHGFTLIELSIVLVIIGLIVGGVLVGKDLIYAAKIRKQISEFQKVEIAVNNFKAMYNALPGDFSKADRFFADSSAGNGDRIINVGGAEKSTAAYNPSFGYSGNPWMERCQFWYHLSAAKLIPESYSVCIGNAAINTHSPKFVEGFTESQFNWIVTAPCISDNCQTTEGYGNQHYIISQSAYNGSSTHNLYMGNNHSQRPAPFTVDDLRAMDIKADDGNALTGNFGVMLSVNKFNYYAAMITDLCTDNSTTDKYKANYRDRECHFWLKTGF